MSSTNKTANLQLSQFLGTDKPAWLGDYNADMQKIDDGYAALKTGEATSTAEIAALQQKDTQLDQDIKDTNDRIDSIATSDITLGNRVTTLEGNYDTMHHEVAANQASINAMLPYAMIGADKKGYIEFRNVDRMGLGKTDEAVYLDVFRDNTTLERLVSTSKNGYSTILTEAVNIASPDNATISTLAQFTVNTGTGTHLQFVSDDEIQIHLSDLINNKTISLVFNKTKGVSMYLNVSGNSSLLFNIPVPTAPVTPTV